MSYGPQQVQQAFIQGAERIKQTPICHHWYNLFSTLQWPSDVTQPLRDRAAHWQCINALNRRLCLSSHLHSCIGPICAGPARPACFAVLAVPAWPAGCIGYALIELGPVVLVALQEPLSKLHDDSHSAIVT